MPYQVNQLETNLHYETMLELEAENIIVEGANPVLEAIKSPINRDPITNISEFEKQKILAQRELWPERVDQVNACKLKTYDIVRAGKTYNVLGAQHPVNSQLKVKGWFAHMTGHHDDNWVVKMIVCGFPLQYTGQHDPQKGHELPNHTSATAYCEHIDRFVESELNSETLIGPFEQRPFTWTSIAPLMTRPKADGVKRRIIVDFSYPDDQGINASIHKNVVFGTYIEHVLPTVNDAVQAIMAHDFAVKLATIDLERAYRNFRVDPLNWPLTCIKHRGAYYVDTAVPFGSRLSSLYMQKVAQFVERALLTKGIQLIMYLDDGLAIIPDDQDADARLLEIMRVIRDLGLPLAYEKVQPPAKRCRFLGIIIDITNKRLEIPMQKIREFKSKINEIREREYMTKKQLQGIIGSINHLSKAVRYARLFMNRLLDALRGATGDRIPICDQVNADLNWFDRFLEDYNGKTLIVTGAPIMTIEADSCMVGAGATNGTQCYMYKYPDMLRETYHITQLEALNCLMAVRAFVSSRHANSIIEVRCDNLPAVTVFQNSRGRDKILNTIARALWFFAARKNIELRFVHIPGTEMCVADALSRASLSHEAEELALRLIRDRKLTPINIHPRYHDFNAYF